MKDRIEEVYLHIYYISLYSEAPAVPHLKDEIHTCLSRIPTLEGSNKLMSEENIYQIFKQSLDGMVDIYMNQAIAEENNPNYIDVSEEVIEQRYLEYARWLSHELSSKGYTDKIETNKEIDEIMKIH